MILSTEKILTFQINDIVIYTTDVKLEIETLECLNTKTNTCSFLQMHIIQYHRILNKLTAFPIKYCGYK